MDIWQGFKVDEFLFEDKKAIVICPQNPDKNRRWIMKAEYLMLFRTPKNSL